MATSNERQVAATRREPDDVLDHVGPGADVVVPLACGEPRVLLQVLDEAAAAGRLEGVRVHQMHTAHDYPFLHGVYGDRLHHVSYFLSAIGRAAHDEGGCSLVPAHFSDMPRLLQRTTRCSLLVARAAPPDRHGYFSLGTNADYSARLLGEVPVFLEVNPHMPRTFGENNVHVSQILGWCEADEPLFEVDPPPVTDLDRHIAAYVAERVPDGATLQAGIGSVPNAVLELLADHRDLDIHTELISDGVVDLVESRAVTGTRKTTRPGKVFTTFAAGSRRTYDWLADNPIVEMLPGRLGQRSARHRSEERFVSINATVEVDFLGQCNPRPSPVGPGRAAGPGRLRPWGDALARGQGFVVLHSTAGDGRISRIVPRLSPGAAVTPPTRTPSTRW
ncbi:MAG: acetyl-CoA hydrolase/transferase C-terminal domain-containing protein [Acidimicrobiales bacterium]